jgi:hypothetical protein
VATSAPTVATPAAASPATVTTTTALSVLGADPAYAESTLTYTWATTNAPAGAPAPSFSANSTNAAKQTSVTFHQAGTYTLQVTITDPASMSSTSNVTVMVAQTLTAITVTPASTTVVDAATQSFTATAFDQFGQALVGQPALLWSVASGGAGGTVAATGLYTAPATGTGSDTVRATSGAVSGSATVTVSTASTGLVDGGFEAPAVGAGRFQYDPTGTPWSYAGAAGVSSYSSGFTAGNPNAPEGTQVAFLQTTGSFSQVITGMAAGTYQLTFDAAQRGNSQASRQNFQILVDGSATGTFTPAGTSYALYTTTTFTVAAGAHTITFQGLDTAGGDNTAFTDNVQLVPVATSTPTVATPAAASPATVTATTTTTLTVLGADPAYAESTLTYTWATTNAPAGAPAPSFSANGTNAAKQTSVTFHQAGTYTFGVTITDPASMSSTSNVTVMVAQTLTAITVTPASTTVVDAATQSFTATAFDQFGQALLSQPALLWSVAPGGAGGTVTATGLYTAPATGTGSDTVRAASGAVSGSATVTVSAASTELADGGFEAPAVGAGHYQYAPTGTPWSYAGAAGVSSYSSGFTAGNPNAPEGAQVAFLQTTGSFSQVVAGLAAGSYKLTFEAAQRGNSQASRQNFQVLVDGLAVGTFTPASTSYALYTTTTFTVAAGAHTITFQGLDSAGGDNTAFVDNVQLVRVVS